jgi:Asp-tRNA(Asn)/Glu-tRNA(Gln) amidotransferase A subunit family amidase
MLPLAPSFDAVGWLTRTGAALDHVATWCLGDEAPLLPARRVVPVEVLQLVEPATREAFEAWAGGTVEEIEVGSLDDWYEAFRVVQAAEAWRAHGTWIDAHPDALGPGVRERFAVARDVTAAQEASARAEVERLAQVVRAIVDDAVLVLPTTPGPAPALTAGADELDRVRAATLRMTALAGIGGLPALSVPALTSPSPLGPAPVGVCLVGPRGSDLSLVRHARSLGGPA